MAPLAHNCGHKVISIVQCGMITLMIFLVEEHDDGEAGAEVKAQRHDIYRHGTGIGVLPSASLGVRPRRSSSTSITIALPLARPPASPGKMAHGPRRPCQGQWVIWLLAQDELPLTTSKWYEHALLHQTLPRKCPATWLAKSRAKIKPSLIMNSVPDQGSHTYTVCILKAMVFHHPICRTRPAKTPAEPRTSPKAYNKRRASTHAAR